MSCVSSLPFKKKFDNTTKKTPEKQIFNYARSALYHAKSSDCLKYFVNDCWFCMFVMNCYYTEGKHL